MVAGGQYGSEATREIPRGFWFCDSSKVLGSHLDFLEEEVELRVAVRGWQGTALWDWVGMAEGQKIAIVQIRPLAMGYADGVDISTWRVYWITKKGVLKTFITAMA